VGGLLSVMQTGRSGLSAKHLYMSIIGNNIANVNTVGFKRNKIEFCDILRQNFGHKGIPVIPANEKEEVSVRTVAEVGHGVKVVNIDKVFNQGVLKKTGRDLDLAINGEGFFAVVDNKEQIFYTRDGSFFLDKDGYMVNAKGFKLLDVKFSAEITDIVVNEDGQVIASSKDGKKTINQQISLYRFENISGLKAVGDNLFLATEEVGMLRKGIPGEEGVGSIKQKYLEMSNVNIASEMVNMIEAQRAYAFNSRVVSVADEMWGIANNIKRS